VQTIGGVRVIQVTPFTLKSRPVGKLFNILAARWLVRSIAALRPALVWIYNSYAFEARSALLLSRHSCCEMVLELEDLPRSRRRGLLNLKPLLDSFYLRMLKDRATLITCVNSSIETRLKSGRTFMLPYIMSPFLRTAGNPPFASAPHTLGYFGGLSKEKGASILPELCDALPTDWRMVVTGRGNLAPDLRAYAAKSGGNMLFCENVSDERLYELLDQCDVVVNPHTSIASMGQGVFPFKVLEAVASGRLVISTSLPPCSFDLSHNVINFDGTVAGACGALATAPEFLRRNCAGFNKTVTQIRSSLSEDAIYTKLTGLGIFS
jgi:glycosyltransferase involved in cell wall biosynthesis